jgi:hypothetical protein
VERNSSRNFVDVEEVRSSNPSRAHYIKPQVNGQMAPSAMLDVEEVRSSILLAPTT